MVADLGECTAPSPLRDTQFIDADERVLYRDDLDELRGYLLAGVEPPSFELAGDGTLKGAHEIAVLASRETAW